MFMLNDKYGVICQTKLAKNSITAEKNLEAANLSKSSRTFPVRIHSAFNILSHKADDIQALFQKYGWEWLNIHHLTQIYVHVTSTCFRN